MSCSEEGSDLAVGAWGICGRASGWFFEVLTPRIDCLKARGAIACGWACSDPCIACSPAGKGVYFEIPVACWNQIKAARQALRSGVGLLMRI